MKGVIVCLLVALVFPFQFVQADSVGQGPITGSRSFQQFLPTIQNDLDGWEWVGDGIQYKRWVLPDPNRIYVTRMDRGDPGVFLESSIGTGELVSGRETVSGMASRYDQAINYWGGAWGGRNHVVVAINGDYFNPPSGYPENGQVQAGWYTKRYNDYEGWSGFAWTMDRDAFIGQCIMHPPDRQYITFANGQSKQRIDGVNAPRGGNELILYTYQYASNTGTDDAGVEVLVEVGHPASVVPSPRSVKGRVTAIRDNRGSTLIPFDTVIISAQGRAREALLANIKIGDEIGITQEIRSLDKDCETQLPEDWTNVYASIGGAFTFLREGEPQHLNVSGAVARNPRTAIAMNDQYIFFVVVDGRAPGVSVGMSLDELAVFAEEELNASWGIAQDGGGSSTMVINGEVVNVPSDPCHKVSLANVDRSPVSKATRLGMVETMVDVVPDPNAGLCQRQVANGMMMVVGQPMEQSKSYSPGMSVTTLRTTDVRLGPGTNYGTMGILPPNMQGVVAHHNTGLDGVEARGSYWWFVSFGDLQGWIPQENMIFSRILRPDLPSDR